MKKTDEGLIFASSKAPRLSAQHRMPRSLARPSPFSTMYQRPRTNPVVLVDAGTTDDAIYWSTRSHGQEAGLPNVSPTFCA